jgi:hypothetical protein
MSNVSNSGSWATRNSTFSWGPRPEAARLRICSYINRHWRADSSIDYLSHTLCIFETEEEDVAEYDELEEPGTLRAFHRRFSSASQVSLIVDNDIELSGVDSSPCVIETAEIQLMSAPAIRRLLFSKSVPVSDLDSPETSLDLIGAFDEIGNAKDQGQPGPAKVARPHTFHTRTMSSDYLESGDLCPLPLRPLKQCEKPKPACSYPKVGVVRPILTGIPQYDIWPCQYSPARAPRTNKFHPRRPSTPELIEFSGTGCLNTFGQNEDWPLPASPISTDSSLSDEDHVFTEDFCSEPGSSMSEIPGNEFVFRNARGRKNSFFLSSPSRMCRWVTRIFK